jgi:hypothetical protein
MKKISTVATNGNEPRGLPISSEYPECGSYVSSPEMSQG